MLERKNEKEKPEKPEGSMDKGSMEGRPEKPEGLMDKGSMEGRPEKPEGSMDKGSMEGKPEKPEGGSRGEKPESGRRLLDEAETKIVVIVSGLSQEETDKVEATVQTPAFSQGMNEKV